MIIGVLISAIDVLALTFGLDDPLPHGISATRQFIGIVGSVTGVITTLIVGIPRGYILYLAAKWFKLPIYWDMPGYSDGMMAFYCFVGDLLVWYLYFLIFWTIRLLWRRHVESKSAVSGRNP